MRLLVLDDDAGDRKAICRVLAKTELDHEVIEAADLEEAASYKGPLDLAFVDFSLPGRNGLTAMQELQAERQDLAVVMMSGVGTERLAAEAIKRGALDYLPKSEISPGQLLRTIENALAMAAMRRRLAEKTEELELFAHALAHDLKSPARLCAYLAASLCDDIAGGVVEDLAGDAEALSSLGQRMVALVDSLAAHLAIEAPAASVPVFLDEALEGAKANLALEIGTSGAWIEAEPLPRAMGDAAQYVQLFQNLLGNALKYAGPRPPRIRIGSETDESGRPVIFVSDEGIGMEPSDCRRIFDSFARLHAPEEYPGSGLGLATCRKIVQRQGGRIWCESAPGAGATFRFTVPAAPALSPPQPGKSRVTAA
ncbi:sensor histidine kinase [Pseudoroseicyclus tamaricis]|uniref:histidine kinase n=1 Tax=Pseudoroseicyclus tamaricis TaxID=2705421 RepID=A0A6B2JWJ3_9RHOB|nr:hybrid sensor histidine kinase/response regulator [Pseudoroseicyclus tamaricis]NDV01029.1 response regulator [Pseudoroseicyclus tamaricis]